MPNNSGINKIMLAGYVGTNPRWHTSMHGKWLHFTLITTEIIKSVKGNVDHEETHHVRLNEKCTSLPDLKFDDFVFLQGKIKTNAFIDNENIKRYKTEITASAIELLK